MKTIKLIKATPNHSARTFTLRIYTNGKLTGKYRTIKFNKIEFKDELNNTPRDWSDFFKTSDYYRI
jgi:hypothetical protein